MLYVDTLGDMSHDLSLFFFNHPATTEIYTLSLHDALPIYVAGADQGEDVGVVASQRRRHRGGPRRVAQLRNFQRRDLREVRVVQLRFHLVHPVGRQRSEEHTSELQSHSDLVCRLLLEKKNK